MLLGQRLPFGFVFTKIRRSLVTVAVIAIVVELAVDYYRTLIPDIPPAIPAFLGTAISLVLSFKLNHSYDRWWEARKIWGSIVNDSRTLVRQALTFAPGAAELVDRLARRQIAWCYCLGQSLRGVDWKIGTTDHLGPAEIEEASGHTNKPLALMQFHGRDLASLAEEQHVTDYQRIAMDETLTRLVDSMGRAERINTTVFPRTYGFFVHAFVYLFVVILSVSLTDVVGAWQVATTIAISLPFFALERTSVHMQDPFANRPTDTAMTAIARTIEINIRQLLGDSDVPQPWAPHDFYLM